MKKIILSIGVVALCATIKAATCSWTGAGVALYASGDSATSYSIYLLDNSVTSASDMATALSGGDTSLISAATVYQTSGIAVSTTSARWAVSGIGDYTAGDSYTYYTVIFNNDMASADAYMITSTLTKTVPASGSMAMTFGTQASNTWQTMSVPEPTSGLLMLLGVAGLALRRRRA